MKKFLFIDNYRGFSRATVPLVDVNFMVGENSTGKTSVLGLLKILSSSSFFMGPGFGGGEDVRFGHFNEMVSAHAEDRSHFHIGFVEENTHPSGKGKICNGMLLTYKEQSAMPKLSRLTFAQGQREISLRYEGDDISYRSVALPNQVSPEELSLSLGKWCDDHATEGSGWKRVELPKGIDGGSQLPVYILLHFAVQTAKFEHFPTFPMFLNEFGNPLVWIDPIRTRPRRTYDEPNTTYSSEGTHTPYVIRRILSSGSTEEKARFKAFMEDVGKASGLFQSIGIKRFGETSDAPFEVDVVLDNKPLNLLWVGYGVSQSLPIFVELLDRPDGSWFAIQQPEVHLHPRAQASLGDVFFEMAVQDKKRFVIETHSDFTIDRFRLNYRRKIPKKEKHKVPKSQVLFFARRDKKNTVSPILIGQDGEFIDPPEGYRSFFVKEEMNVLGL